MSNVTTLSRAAIIRIMGDQVVRCTLHNGYAVEDIKKMRLDLQEIAASRGQTLEEDRSRFNIGRNFWLKPKIRRERTGTIEFRSKDFIFHVKDEETGKITQSGGQLVDIVVPKSASEAIPKFRVYLMGNDPQDPDAKYLEYVIIPECKVQLTPDKYRTDGHSLFEYSKAQDAYVHVMTDSRYKGKRLIQAYEELV